jgi:DNA-directed RNA polymerase specialized sigma24 family protein
MASLHPSPVLRFIRKIAASGGSGDLTDKALLESFVTGPDPGAAFAALVQRHGAMVLAVCRRILHHAQDVEDAFQATFLVLVRKAGSLSQPELLGPWLYGVAYRTAVKARAVAAKRRAQERPLVDLPGVDATDDVVWRDLRPVLDSELNHLTDCLYS